MCLTCLTEHNSTCLCGRKEISLSKKVSFAQQVLMSKKYFVYGFGFLALFLSDVTDYIIVIFVLKTTI